MVWGRLGGEREVDVRIIPSEVDWPLHRDPLKRPRGSERAAHEVLAILLPQALVVDAVWLATVGAGARGAGPAAAGTEVLAFW